MPVPTAAEVEPIADDKALAIMRDIILYQYHLSAVAGDEDMQMDALARFDDLVAKLAPTRPDDCVADIKDYLFQETAALDGEPPLFGQAFKRIVDLGPCRAEICFRGFDIVGGSLDLHAVDPGPFISPTGYKSCLVLFRGWSRKLVHSLEGRSVLDYMTELSKEDLKRHKKTGELIVVPWKPFSQWTPDHKQAAA